MANTGYEAFDTTVQKSNQLLKLIEDGLQLPSRQQAYHVLRAFLHTLRDRIGIGEAADFGSQLPMLIRGIYYESYKPSPNAPKFNKSEFLLTMQDKQGVDISASPEDCARIAWQALSVQISDGEAINVLQVLPKSLASFFESLGK